MPASENSITSILGESRRFKPKAKFSRSSLVGNHDKYLKLWRQSIKSPDTFWAKAAKENLTWFKPFRKTLEWNIPHAKWFLGGKIKASFNCIDRHILAGKQH